MAPNDDDYDFVDVPQSRPRRAKNDEGDRDRDRDIDYGDSRRSRPKPRFEEPSGRDPRDIDPSPSRHDLEGKTSKSSKDFRSRRNDYEDEEGDILRAPKQDKSRKKSPKGGYSDDEDDDSYPSRRRDDPKQW